MNVRDPQQDPDERIAVEAVDRLLGSAGGLALVGPQARIDRIIPRLHARCHPRTLLPVVFPADHGTPDSLRDAVQRAHAGRPGIGTAVLLIVPDAGRLSAALLRELDMAADAAAEFGGLKFVLASTSPVRPLLREAGLQGLHDALGADLAVPASISAPQPMRPVTTAGRPRPPAHLLRRILLAAAILAAFVLVVMLVLATIRPDHPAPAVPAQPSFVPQTPPAPPPPPPAQTVPESSGKPAYNPSPLPPAAQPAPLSATPAAPSSPAPAAPAPSGTPAYNPPPSLPPAQATPVPSGTPAFSPPLSSPPVQPPAAVVPAPSQPSSVPPPPASSSLLLVAQPGDTLPVLFARVYAGSNPPPFAQVQALNPIVRPGTRLVFPPPPAGWPSKP